MRGRNDVLIGVAANAAVMALGLLVVPVFVRLLGIESYGLIGFLALMQAALQLLDMGLSPTVSREVAKARAANHYDPIGPLVRSLARFYIWTGIAIAAAFLLLSSPIAHDWLKPGGIDLGTMRTSIVVMGVILAARWPVAIYSGVLIGAHRIDLLSKLSVSVAILNQLGGAAAIFLYPDIVVLFLWQAAVATAQLVLFRHHAWRVLGLKPTGPMSLRVLKEIWRFSVGMSVITMLAVILSQLDRLVLSKLVSLDAFGAYALASVVGRALYGLINPVFNVIYPRFTVMLERGDMALLERSYGEWTNLFCAAFFPASMVLVIAAHPLVLLWSGDPALTDSVAPMVMLLAAGSALHGSMFFPFAAQVAAGDSRTPVIINMIVLAFYVPALVALVLLHGAWGAALAWCLVFAVYLPLGTWITHRKIMRGRGRSWLFGDVFAPLAISTAIGATAYLVKLEGRLPMAADLALSACAGGLAALACIASAAWRHPGVRDLLSALLHFITRRFRGVL